MTTRRYPRVLVIDSAFFSRRTNVGIVLSNLFDGWPKHSLAQICYNIGQPDFDVCSRFWRLTKAAVIRASFGSSGCSALAPLDYQSGPPGSTMALLNAHDSRSTIERVLGKANAAIRTPITEALFRLPMALPPPLVKWIEDFSPEAVFSTLGNGLMLQLVCRVAERRQLPVIPYFTDDWIETYYEGALFGGLLKRSMRCWMNRCLERSPLRLVVSRTMADEYHDRYGCDFEIMKYAVKATDLVAMREMSDAEPVEMVYTGGLVPDRWQQLRDIAEALIRLDQNGVPARLSIYTDGASIRDHGNELSYPPIVSVHEWIPYEELQRVFQRADVLVHVESFDNVFRRWTRYSISTKIADYLMSGRCLFAYGPAEGAALCSIEENAAGVVVSRRDKVLLEEKLKEMLLNPAARAACGERARKAAMREHEAVGQAERFRQMICQAVDRHDQRSPRLSNG
jgi:glycosyltransferase involved in cell wall biosynthesis